MSPQVKTFIFCIFFLFTTKLFSQGIAVNKDGAVADKSAMLDISAANQGMLVPRIPLLTDIHDAITIPLPAHSLLIYTKIDGQQPGEEGFYYNNGTPDAPEWLRLSTTNPNPTSGWLLEGNAGTNPGVNFFGTIDNQEIVFRQNNEKIGYIARGGALGFTGNTTTGVTPFFLNGEGTKLLYIPERAAFRVGKLDDLAPDFWNANNIGAASFAANFNTKASGIASFAVGYGTQATGSASMAFGNETISSEFASTSMGNHTTASGAMSVAMGSYSVASGSNAIAAGNQSAAAGENSFTAGYKTKASALNSFATGNNTVADAETSTAIGQETLAHGENSLATGYLTKAYGKQSTATGWFSKAYDSASTAMGYNTLASGKYSFAVGYSAKATSIASAAFGFATEASGSYSFAIGSNSNAIGNYSFSSGYSNTTANGVASMAIGKGTTTGVNAQNAFAQGNATIASGINSIATGFSTTANGENAVAMGDGTGNNNGAYGKNSVVMGLGTTTTNAAQNAFAQGQGSVVYGVNAIATGQSATARGLNSFAGGTGTTTTTNAASALAMGNGTTAVGINSVAMNDNTLANGNNTAAFGDGSKAYGKNSFVMGNGNTVYLNGQNAFAQGLGTEAYGINSVVIGESTLTTISARNGFAQGNGTESRGENSSAFGIGTIASARHSMVLGTFNDALDNPNPNGSAMTDRIFQVGGGSGPSNAERNNALTVLRSGRTAVGDANPQAMLDIRKSPYDQNYKILRLADDSQAAYYEVDISNAGQQGYYLEFTTNADKGRYIFRNDVYKQGNNDPNQGTYLMDIGFNGNTFISGVLQENSDMRLKENVRSLTNVLSKVNNIQPITYYFKDKKAHPAAHQIGFSAQEIQQQFPELVAEDANKNLSVNYTHMSAVLLQAIKEQQQQIEELKKEKQGQKEINTQLLQRLEKIEAAIKK